MLEAEYNELNKFTIQASEAIADYNDRFNDLTSKDKKYIIEKILAYLDIVLVFTMNIRHQILQQLATSPNAIRIQLNQHLSELKVTVETTKTLSFNYTTILNSIRDDLKNDVL